MKIAVVVVAYNRPTETRRLIDSICAAYYDNDKVDLIVDIDKGELQEDIVSEIQTINWRHGEYNIIKRDEKMGLRPHIYACGAYTRQYDAVIVLEDDILVAESYYLFAKNACVYYDDDERVSQISLYAYAVNEFESRPFYPEKNASDVYMIQVAQSWGECWTKRMWNAFTESDSYAKESFTYKDSLHNRVNAWKKTSWKKNFFHYLIDSDTYVVYPYYSFVTNYSEQGEHCKKRIPDYHVVMQTGVVKEYKLLPFHDCVKYDSFFERVLDAECDEYNNICMDLYGSKTSYGNASYLISTKSLPYRTIETYGLIRRPHEVNVVQKERGEGIFVYDLSHECKPPKRDEEIMLRYDFAYLEWRRTVRHALHCIVIGIKEKIRLNQ